MTKPYNVIEKRDPTNSINTLGILSWAVMEMFLFTVPPSDAYAIEYDHVSEKSGSRSFDLRRPKLREVGIFR